MSPKGIYIKIPTGPNKYTPRGIAEQQAEPSSRTSRAKGPGYVDLSGKIEARMEAAA